MCKNIQELKLFSNENTNNNNNNLERRIHRYVWQEDEQKHYMILEIQIQKSDLIVDLKEQDNDEIMYSNNIIYFKKVKGYTSCGSDVDEIEIKDFFRFIEEIAVKEYQMPIFYMNIMRNDINTFYNHFE